MYCYIYGLKAPECRDFFWYFSCPGKKSTKRIRHRRGVYDALPRAKCTLSYVPHPHAPPAMRQGFPKGAAICS